MTDEAGREHAPLSVDVDGLPQRLQDPQQRAGRRWQQALVVLGGGLLLVAVVRHASPETFPAMLGGMWFLQGGLGLLVAARAHVALEPEGVRRVGLVGRGRLTPWSQVVEVRPPDTFHPASHVRGPGGRFAETTDLPGLPAEDAVELQRRLEAARRTADEAGQAPG